MPGTPKDVVLIVCEQSEDTGMIFETLRQAGYKTIVVENGKQAVLHVESEKPDIVLMSLRLPDMEGFDCYSKLKNNRYTFNIPVIFLTPQNHIDPRLKSFELENVDFITEPYNPEEILIRVKRNIELQKIQKQSERQNVRLLKEIVKHKRTMKRLQESEQRFRLITENAPDFIVEIDRNARILYMNRTPDPLKKDHYIGTSLYDWMPPAYSPIVQKAIDNVFTKGIFQEYEAQSIRFWGEMKWYTARIAPVVKNDKIFTAILIASDISERKQFEEELIKRESNLALIVRIQQELLSPDWKEENYQAVLEKLCTIAEASRSYICEYTRSREGRTSLKKTSQWAHPKYQLSTDSNGSMGIDYNLFFPHWKKILSKRGVIQGIVKEFREAEKKLLESQNVRSMLILPLMIGQEFSGFIGFDDCENERSWKPLELSLLQSAAAAISLAKKQRQTKSALEESYERFEIVMNSVNALMYVADMESYDLLFINQYGKNIFGNVEGDKCWQTLQKDRKGPCPFCTNKYLLKNGKPTGVYTWEFKNTLTNRWYYIQDQAIRWIDSRYVRLEIATDITELKQSEAALKKAKSDAESANRAKSEFLANMSHEIRTPMNAILGFAEILEEKIVDPEQQNYLSMIRSSGKSLLNLINDILDLTKIEVGKIELEYYEIDVRLIYSEIRKIFSQKIAEKGIEFIIDIDNDFPEALLLDETRIRQILLNLVGNAVKFTSEGYIKISAGVRHINHSEKTCDIVFSVEDTGIGIPGDQKKKIFGAFDQVRNNKHIGYGGTGLGLAITKRLVEMMGGRISVGGQQGKGSVFQVMIDHIKIGKAPEKRISENQDGLREIIFENALILIADDQTDNRILIKEFLKEYAFDTIEAVNGREAVQFAKKYQPDLILMDLKMPGLDGREATHIIKSQPGTGHIPVVAVTASAMKESREKIENLCDGYLSKPIHKKDLVAEVMKFIRYSKRITTEEPQKTDFTKFGFKKELSEKDRKKLSKLIQELEEHFLPRWKEIHDVMIMEDIRHFSGELQKVIRKYPFSELESYCDQLNNQAKCYNIESVNQLLIQFPEIIHRAKNYIKRV